MTASLRQASRVFTAALLIAAAGVLVGQKTLQAAPVDRVHGLETDNPLAKNASGHVPFLHLAQKGFENKFKNNKRKSAGTRKGKKSTSSKKARSGGGSTSKSSSKKTSVARGPGSVAVRRYDKNGDGRVSRSEWPKSDEIFKRIDRNGDGFLVGSEFIANKARRAKKGKPAAPVSVWAADDSDSLTIKEASAVTDASGDQPVAAVPPTIDDIAAILDQQKLADPALAEKQRAAAAAEPPAGTKGAKLALFYRARGKAAGKIGESEQEIADLRKAAALATKSGSRKRPNILADLASALLRRGEAAEAVTLRKQSIAAAQSMRKTNGLKIKSMANLVSLYIKIGNVRAARALMSEIEQLLGKTKSKAPAEKWRYDWFPRALHAKADLLQAQGRIDKAEDLLRAGVKLVEQAIKRNVNAEYGAAYRDNIRRALARNLLFQGRLVEAEIEARAALLDVLARVGKYSSETPPNLLQFVNILLEQGRTEEAAKLAQAAIGILEKTGAKSGSAARIRATRVLAQAKVQAGAIPEAMAIYDGIDAAARKDRWIYNSQMLRDKEWMLALILSGRHSEAKALLTEALALQKKKRRKQNSALQGLLAMATQKEGDAAQAMALYEKAAPKLVNAKEAQEDEEYTLRTSRDFRAKAIMEGYLGLLADQMQQAGDEKLRRDHAARAFAIADLARGQSVQRAVSASAARARVDDPDLAKLVRDEQDTRKRITAQSALLANALATPTDQQDAATIEGLRASVKTLRSAADTLTREIEKRFPNYGEVLKPQAPDPEKVRAALHDDEVYISIYIGRSRTFLWAVPKSGPLLFETSRLTRDRAAKTVAALRDALNPTAETLGDIPDFDTRLSNKLYRDILAPLRPAWGPAKSILVSVDGALGQLPLSVLTTERFLYEQSDGPLFAGYREAPWLARTHAITLIPSSAALITLRSTPAAAATRKPFIGFGDPYFSGTQATAAATPRKETASATPQAFRSRGLPIRLRAAPSTHGVSMRGLSILPRLPDTAAEVRSLALAMADDPSGSVLLGKAANESTVKSASLSDYRVIAFATHGLIPGDLTGLREPALALSAPEVADVDGDGLLTMTEIMGLRLNADWVILSACNTGTGRGAGAEAVSGLGRAFFYAGTRALLVSSWPVETTSARLLTTDVFSRMTQKATLTRASALQQAVSALIDKPGQIDEKTRKPLFYYAHPIFWAPFVLVGDGG